MVYFVMMKTMIMAAVMIWKILSFLMLVIITSTLRYFHTDIVSPIFPIGRVVRILLRTQKKEWKRKLRPNMVMLIIIIIMFNIIIAGSNCCPACSRRRCYLAKRTAAASFFLLFAFYSTLLMINDN